MSSYGVIANQPVVIDNGSGVIKAGFAGEQMPKCKFANFVGRPKHLRVMAGALEGDVFVGTYFISFADIWNTLKQFNAITYLYIQYFRISQFIHHFLNTAQ